MFNQKGMEGLSDSSEHLYPSSIFVRAAFLREVTANWRMLAKGRLAAASPVRRAWGFCLSLVKEQIYK